MPPGTLVNARKPVHLDGSSINVVKSSELAIFRQTINLADQSEETFTATLLCMWKLIRENKGNVSILIVGNQGGVSKLETEQIIKKV